MYKYYTLTHTGWLYGSWSPSSFYVSIRLSYSRLLPRRGFNIYIYIHKLHIYIYRRGLQQSVSGKLFQVVPNVWPSKFNRKKCQWNERGRQNGPATHTQRNLIHSQKLLLYTSLQQCYKAIILWTPNVRVVEASSRWSNDPEFKNCFCMH